MYLMFTHLRIHIYRGTQNGPSLMLFSVIVLAGVAGEVSNGNTLLLADQVAQAQAGGHWSPSVRRKHAAASKTADRCASSDYECIDAHRVTIIDEYQERFYREKIAARNDWLTINNGTFVQIRAPAGSAVGICSGAGIGDVYI